MKKYIAITGASSGIGAATGAADYDYDASFKNYHSSEQMAEFLLQLYDSDKCVGSVDRNTFEFSLSEPKFSYAIKYR